LAETSFNLSRLPQKFGDHLAAGPPLLCSTTGECGRLIGGFKWAIPAGTTREDWLAAFRGAVDRLAGGDVPAFDPDVVREQLSWDGLSRRLAGVYHAVLVARPTPGR